MINRAGSSTPDGARKRKRVLASVIVAGCVVSVPVLLAGSVSEAARLTATAVAEIIRASTGISSQSNFEVGLPPLTDGQIEIVVKADTGATARLNNTLIQARLISRPATFGVSGEPNQVYSVALPSQPATQTTGFGQETVVVFSDFSHDAGLTPSMGADGTAVFAVGARVVAQPAADGGEATDVEDTDATAGAGSEEDTATDEDAVSDAQNPLTLNLPDTANLQTSAGTSDDRLTSVVRQHNPFSFALDPRFLNVLVSYN